MYDLRENSVFNARQCIISFHMFPHTVFIPHRFIYLITVYFMLTILEEYIEY